MAGAPSSRPGMGAVPYGGGVTFRLWAPNATGVGVAGDFNGWAAAGTTLAGEPGGLWSADVPGAVPGQAYQFLITTANATLTRVDPYARQVVSNDTGDAVKAVIYDEAAFSWADESYSSPGWTEMVIYELHVGSFGAAAAGMVGTLGDVAARLPYLRDLGINAVELLPLASFEGAISWGYDPGLPFSVEQPYGGPDGLKAFVQAAHAHGIAVILDVVYNHFGPQDSILWDFDGSGPAWPGGIYFYGRSRAQTPWGSRPDYGRPEVREYLVDNATAWLQDYRLDGLRLDATAYVRNVGGNGDPSLDIPDGWGLLQQINDAVDGSQPWKIVIAEDMQGNGSITRPTAGQGAGFDAQWDAAFVQQLRAVVEQVQDAGRDMGAIQAALESRDAASAFARVIYTESHDADGNGRTRVPTEIDPAQPDSWWSKKRSTLAAALVFTAPGIPMIFQGQEFLDQDPFVQEPIPPLDWADATKYAGIVQLYRDLIQLRRDWHDTTRGLKGDGLNVFHINNTGKLIAYHRWSRGGPLDDVVVALNFANRGYSSYTIGLPRTGRWRVRFNSDWAGYDPSFGNWPGYDTDTDQGAIDGLPAAANIGIGPYTALILSQDP